MVTAISAVSAAFSPAAGSSSSSRTGLDGQRAGDVDPLRHPVGQRPPTGSSSRSAMPRKSQISATRATCLRSVRDAQPQPGRRGTRRWSARAGRACTLSSTVEPGDSAMFWNDRPMPSAASRCGARAVISSLAEPDRPDGRPVEAADHVEAAGLAGAVRPDQRVDGARLDGEPDVVQRRDAAERAASRPRPRAHARHRASGAVSHGPSSRSTGALIRPTGSASGRAGAPGHRPPRRRPGPATRRDRPGRAAAPRRSRPARRPARTARSGPTSSTTAWSATCSAIVAFCSTSTTAVPWAWISRMIRADPARPSAGRARARARRAAAASGRTSAPGRWPASAARRRTAARPAAPARSASTGNSSCTRSRALLRPAAERAPRPPGAQVLLDRHPGEHLAALGHRDHPGAAPPGPGPAGRSGRPAGRSRRR